MKEQQIWIKTMDSAAEVGNLILALFEEDEDYSGEMRVLVGKQYGKDCPGRMVGWKFQNETNLSYTRVECQVFSGFCCNVHGF